MPNKYAKDTKKFTFYAKDKLHAKFKIRMQFHDLTQSEFLRACVEAVVEQDRLMELFINDYKEKNNKQSKKQRENIKKEQEEGSNLLKEFGMEESDLESIFDIIAKEHPEI
jgi:hypothetical protein